MQAEHDFPSVISFLLYALDVDVSKIPYIVYSVNIIHNSTSKRSFVFAVLVLDFRPDARWNFEKFRKLVNISFL